MRPAFSSTRQAAAFALLLLALLLAPVLAQKILPPRETIYSSIWWASGDFPYMDGQIFREQSDVDIMFMGSSHIWAGFDTPYVQAQLGKQLGHPAVARTFGWAWPGYDPLYFVAKDLFAHRHVRMLVFEDDFDPGRPASSGHAAFIPVWRGCGSAGWFAGVIERGILFCCDRGHAPEPAGYGPPQPAGGFESHKLLGN